MLKKLIKYDMKSLGRILLPLYAVTLVVGAVSALLSRASELSTFTLFDFSHNIFTILSSTVFVFLFIGTCVMSIVLSILRFRQNLLGKEGYLTNVLPVSTDKHIMSKTFSATVWQIITGIFAGVSLLLFMMIRYGTDLDLGSAFRNLMAALPNIFAKFGATSIFISILQVLGMVLCSILLIAGKNLMFYASLAVGHIANSKKVLLSFAAYIGFYLLSQSINIAAITSYSKFVDRFNISIMSRFTTYLEGYLPIFISLLLFSIFYILFYFFIIKYCLSKKLNLE